MLGGNPGSLLYRDVSVMFKEKSDEQNNSLINSSTVKALRSCSRHAIIIYRTRVNVSQTYMYE